MRAHQLHFLFIPMTAAIYKYAVLDEFKKPFKEFGLLDWWALSDGSWISIICLMLLLYIFIVFKFKPLIFKYLYYIFVFFAFAIFLLTALKINAITSTEILLA